MESKLAMQTTIHFLREFARRSVVERDEGLAPLQDVKDGLMGEVWKTARVWDLTERDVAVLIYKGILSDH